jgi:hypothetical protein
MLKHILKVYTISNDIIWQDEEISKDPEKEKLLEEELERIIEERRKCIRSVGI